jgi:putative tryptophan/tyrosine transport system substrate-binding protein
MRRREFISLLGGAAAWPLAARAQQEERTRRVGVFTALAADEPVFKARFEVFHRELERLGWSPARNLRLDYRFGAGQSDRYPVLAQELIASQPDAIVGHTTQVATALRRATHTIPIVFLDVSDPIGAGFITNLARPGHNMTGVLLYEAGIVGKWLALLKEVAPHLRRVAVVGNPKTTAFDYFLAAAEAAAPSMPVDLSPMRVGDAAEIERAVDSLASASNSGLLVLPDPTTVGSRALIVALAAQHRLPAVYPFRLFTAAGGLMAYETDQSEISRLVASYIDRILHGAKPADLPVQVPTKYATVLNLKTAMAIGLEVPPSLLARADELIE